MKKIIYFAGGCFWGIEKYFGNIFGVTDTEVGYANGLTSHPAYNEIAQTGHVETVKITYDSNIITLNFLLDLLYEVIDPTSFQKQGNDVGSQYRTGIYYLESEEREVILKSLEHLQKNYKKEIVVEVLPLDNYFPAEKYHQKYLDKNVNGYCHIPLKTIEDAKKITVDPYLYQKLEKEKIKKELTPLSYEVTQNNATEKPFNNEYNDVFQKGIYVDITTGEPLFLSSDKYESGCGWPAFSKPIDSKVLVEKEDYTLGMERTEIRSRIGDAHLGHVFEDGPLETGGLRYCINSASLRFIPYEKLESEGYGYLLKLFNDQ